MDSSNPFSPENYRPHRSLASVLAWIYRKFPITRTLKLEGMIKKSPAIGFPPIAWRKIGPIPVGVEVQDYYQRLMLIDVYEPEVWSLFKDVLNEGDVYVDIGAQLGFTAAIAAKQIGREGKMLLIEPDPRANTRLETHIKYADRKTCPQITLLKAACSSKHGHLPFLPLDILGHSRVARDETDKQSENIIDVPLVIADEEIERLGYEHIRVLKLDVEGHELEVLRGLQKTLFRKSIDLIMVEKNLYTMADYRAWSQHLHVLISKHGYVGVHEFSGEQVTKESLANSKVMLENLYYSHDPSILKPVTKDSVTFQSDGYSKEELDYLYNEAIDPDHPTHQAQTLISQARENGLEATVPFGEELLAKHPEIHWFRGHLAYWLMSIGRTEEARHQLEILARHAPQDEEAKKSLKRCNSEVPSNAKGK